jgi:hypothetical protein
MAAFIYSGIERFQSLVPWATVVVNPTSNPFSPAIQLEMPR